MSRVKLVAQICLVVFGSMATMSCARDPEVAKRKYLEAGNKYFDQQKYKEAIVEYRNAVQQDPRFGDARYKLAEAYVRVRPAECLPRVCSGRRPPPGQYRGAAQGRKVPAARPAI